MGRVAGLDGLEESQRVGGRRRRGKVQLCVGSRIKRALKSNLDPTRVEQVK